MAQRTDPTGARGSVSGVPDGRTPRRIVFEDPDTLGYRLVDPTLLRVMDAEEWLALEHAALAPDEAPAAAER